MTLGHSGILPCRDHGDGRPVVGFREIAPDIVDRVLETFRAADGIVIMHPSAEQIRAAPYISSVLI